MKKVGLLTIEPRIYNYGGFLQELAVQDAISQVTNNCEIINFSPAQEAFTFERESIMEKLKIKRVIKKLKNITNEIFTSEDVTVADEIRKKAFDLYRNGHLQLSDCVSYENLHCERLPYDTIVCGSDQIWNPDFNIPSFFLDFAKEDQRKVIYAASIGKDSLTKLQLNTYAELMKGLD